MKRIFCLLFILPFVNACSSDAELNLSMEEKFDIAHKAMMNENYAEAESKFESFEKDYPSSKWSAVALIDGAYCAYRENDYLNAMVLSDKFLRFHPGHEDADYMLYLRGVVAFNQVSDIHREQNMAENALVNFNDLVRRFPNSIYVNNAKNKIALLRNQIAGKDLNMARRQMKISNYPASITILQGLIVNFPDTVVIPEVLFRLAESYTAMGVETKANEMINLLKYNYPDSDWAK